MAGIGNVVVSLIARTSVFDRKVKKSGRNMNSLTAQVARTRSAMLGMARAAITLAGVAGLGVVVKRTLAAVDATAKLSDRLQIATEDLVGLQHAAQINGQEIAGMNKGIETFVRRLGEVRLGTGQAKVALEAMGLTADELVENSNIEALKIIADRIASIDKAADKAATAYFLFGRQGQIMLNFLNQGAAGIEKFRAEADRLGITFSRIEAARIEAANDAVVRLGASMRGIVQVAVIQMSPALTAIADNLTEISVANRGIGQQTGGGLVMLARSIAVVIDAAQGFKLVFKTATLAVQQFAAKAIGTLSSLAGQIEDMNNKIAGTFVGGKLGVKRSNFAQGFKAWSKAADNAVISTKAAIIEIIATRTNLEAVNAAVGKFAEVTTSAAAAAVPAIEDVKTAAEKLNPVADGIGDAFGSAFEKMVKGARDARDVITAMIQDIATTLIRQNITLPLAAGISGLFTPQLAGNQQAIAAAGGLANVAAQARAFHTGGRVGSGGMPRQVPAGTFAGAPRFHNGLAADEIPAILQRGETVIPKGGGMAAPMIVINNNSGQQIRQDGPVDFDGKQFVVTVVAENIQRGGLLRPMIQNLR